MSPWGCVGRQCGKKEEAGGALQMWTEGWFFSQKLGDLGQVPFPLPTSASFSLEQRLLNEGPCQIQSLTCLLVFK